MNGALVRICELNRLPVDRGVPALLADRTQVAVFRLADDAVYAVGQRDPYGDANVMSRGLVGSTTLDGVQVPTVASPLHKQRFDLRTGLALADPQVGLGSYPVQILDGVVHLETPD